MGDEVLDDRGAEHLGNMRRLRKVLILFGHGQRGIHIVQMSR